MKNPTQCELWKQPDLITEPMKNRFELLETYADESHLIRDLLKCRECGQLYFHEFYEEIDWENGNDPQYTTWIPIDSSEDAQKLNKLPPFELLQFFPRLQKDFPMDAETPTVRWMVLTPSNEKKKTFAEILKEQTQFGDELGRLARRLIKKVEESDDVEEHEQLIATADEIIKLANLSSQKFETRYAKEFDALKSAVEAGKKERLQKVAMEALRVAKDEDLYLTPEEQKTRRIAFINCEDEEGCGFGVEFKHPNSTFFFCKEHRWGVNLDLDTLPAAGVKCQEHGQMERYDLLKDDNVCPICEKSMLAILSVGR